MPRGSFKEYGNYEKLKECGEVENYEEFVNRFNEDYSEETYWYKMISTRYKNYCMISINSKNIIYADMNNVTTFENSHLQELLDFLIIKVKECINKLEEGTYNNYIKDNYSYKNRFGVIKRNEYWEIYPEVKDELLNETSQEEINYFMENASYEIESRIKCMTSAKYFECVKLAYKNIEYDMTI